MYDCVLRGIKLRIVTTIDPSDLGALYSKFPGFWKGAKSTEHDSPAAFEFEQVIGDHDVDGVGEIVTVTSLHG